MNEINYKDFYPNFTIICDKCGSQEVYVENDVGWSELSGGWGGVHLVCNRCNNSTTIYEHM